MKKRWVVAALAGVVLAGAGGAWWGGLLPQWGASSAALAGTGGAPAAGEGTRRAGKGSDAKPAVPLEFLPSEVVQPTLARLPTRLEFSGPLVAPNSAVLRARAGGTLLSLQVSEGSRVRAGQALGRIELAEADTRVAERGALLESARAALAQAERTHASNQRLAAQQFISATALDQSQAALDTARAQFNAAQASLATSRVALRDTVLAAPIAGIVAKRHVLPGEKLSLEQPVLSIVDLSRLELAALVGTHEISRITPGMTVQVQVEGMLQAVEGQVARIAPAAEPGTRSISVAIALANPQERLRAGQYAMARLTLEDDTDRLTLPESALGQTSGQDHVWLIEQGVLARRAVTLGRRDALTGRVEVLQGVDGRSQVLAARFDNLREGAPASVAAAAATPGAGAAPVASAAAGTTPQR